MKNSACRNLSLLAGSTLYALAALAPAVAADWHFDPRLSLTGIYDDNRFLDTDSTRANSVNGLQLDAAASIAALSPRNSVRFVPHVWTHRYPGDSDQDETNGELGFFYDHAGETTKAYLRSSFSRNSLLRNVLPAADISEGLGENLHSVNSRLSLDGEQFSMYVDPSFEWRVNTRNRLTASADYQARDYSGAVSNDYIDNQGLSTSLAWSYDWSRRTAVSFAGIYGHYTPDVGSDTNLYGVRADWSRSFTEISRYYLRVGMNRTERKVGAVQQSDNALSAGAGINWAFQITGIFLDLTRNVVPSTAGEAITQDEVRLRVNRQFKPRVSGFVNLVGVKDGSIYPGALFVARKYVQGQTGFEWRVARTYTLVGSYAYTWERYGETSAGNAASNSVSLSIVYEPHRPEWITGVFR